MKWFSAKLIFRIDCDDLRINKMDSIIVFRARDFSDAHQKALDIGKSRENSESIVNSKGEPEITLTLCKVENVDVIGKRIDAKEVWSNVSFTRSKKDLSVDLNYEPTQTI